MQVTAVLLQGLHNPFCNFVIFLCNILKTRRIPYFELDMIYCTLMTSKLPSYTSYRDLPSCASISPTMAFIMEDFPTPVFPVNSILIDSDSRLED